MNRRARASNVVVRRVFICYYQNNRFTSHSAAFSLSFLTDVSRYNVIHREKTGMSTSAKEYAQEFTEMLEAYKTMVPLIRDMDDRAIGDKWITRAKSLHSRDVNVLKHRNNFMKYFLSTVRETIAETGQSPKCCSWGKPEPGPFDKRMPPPKPLPYQCHWTPDKRTYVAIQPLPNRGAMVYMAVAEKPELGWEFPKGDE